MASFGGQYYTGQYSYIQTSVMAWPSQGSTYDSVTMSMWFKLNSVSGNNHNQSFITVYGPGYYVPIGVYNGLVFGSYWDCPTLTGQSLQPNKWYFVTLVDNVQATNMSLFLDGQLQSSESCNVNWPSLPQVGSNQIQIVVGYTGAHDITPTYPGLDTTVLNGTATNFQFYNTPLSANEIQALYQEGTGGAPIDILNITVWWPLNANAQDYSGNGNDGQINGVTFTSSWEGGYTAP